MHFYAPKFPVLMADPAKKCGHYDNRRPAHLVALRCVKPAGHDGRHLHDVDPRRVLPQYLPKQDA